MSQNFFLKHLNFLESIHNLQLSFPSVRFFGTRIFCDEPFS